MNLVKRELYINKISPFIDHELIKVITGIRRCGKSYMLNLIKDELILKGVPEKNIIIINFDMPLYNHIENTRELDLLVADLVKDIEGKLYLFFDEIQDVDEWEKSIVGYKLIYDCDIYITGSNSKMLSGELATKLTGRYVEISMYPLSFQEFLDFKMDNLTSDKELFDEYLMYGGMPVVLSLDEEYKLKYLEDLYNSIFVKDIVSRYNIRDFSILKRLVQFVLDNVGKQFSANGIVKYLSKQGVKISRKTIYNYLNYMQEACFINKVPRQDLEGKAILKIDEKYYATDHGFCQAMIGRNKKNISRILENIVYIELLRRDYKITIGKVDDYEIDFVCEKQNKLIYVQVAYYLSDDSIIEREFRPLLLVKDNYPKYVVSLDEFDLSDKGIIHLNLLDFLKNTGNEI